MLNLEKKTWLAFGFLIGLTAIGRLYDYLNNYNTLSYNRYAFKAVLLTLVLIALYYTTKVVISYKANIFNKYFIYILPFLLFFGYRAFNLDFSILKDKSTLYVIGIPVVIYLQCFTEEFIFRGILLNDYLKKGLGIYKSAIYSSIIFGLIHFINISGTHGNVDYLWSVINQVVMATMLGILLSALYLALKNIYIVSLLHALINVPIYIKLNLTAKNADIPTDALYTPISEYLIGVGMIIFIFSPCIIFGFYLLSTLKARYHWKNMEIKIEHPFSFLSKVNS